MPSLESWVIQAQSSELDQNDRQTAFEYLVKHCQNMALASAFAVLQDRQLAQDVTQEAFVTAYQKLGQLREPKAFPSWLQRIVLTQCNRQQRGKHLITTPIEPDQAMPSFELDPAVQLEKNELRQSLLRAIDDLPEHERIVVRLFYLGGYSTKETAQHLSLPISTIKKRLQYARRRLRHTVACLPEIQMMGCSPGWRGTLDQLLKMILNPQLVMVTPHGFAGDL